ncbi:DNA-binding protein [Streptomyces abyssalis]|uniref:DNA-binding protein n=1 Tax=Streptomyces abyssalis TaxID=933944 RepID=A0A1E7JMV8_9ACTN|nr:helix-turn-helix transcriptional regulator [Streptomyces abyssalis]OEU87031.1 DNA-binding protein [Streptomyces abyssalis]OEU89583.1 DNA-binding protein [Streptomyces abyssalis]OEV31939.1 DNA-binding protein [Streptomyces nanshensis]
MAHSAGRSWVSEPDTSDSLKSFGAVVKVFRERAGFTQHALAEEVQYSHPMISSIEQGRRLPPPDFVEKAEEALNAFGVLRAAAQHVGRQPGLATWFREWARLEKEAVNLCTYECRLVPGLLQTETYARAVFDNSLPPLEDSQLESQVTARAERQRLLDELPNSAFSFIIEEAVLMRRLGGVAVTREQLEHLLERGRLRNVEIQIVPATAQEHACLHGPVRLLETPYHRWLGYSEGQENGRLISDQKEVSVLQMRYAKMRSQALSHSESMSLLQRMRGAL